MLIAAGHRAVPCLRCGYDITGLPRDSICPECAFPLRETLEASAFLRSLPRQVVNQIDNGVMVLAWSTIAVGASLPLGFLLMLVWALFDMSGASTGLNVGIAIGCGAAAGCFAVGSILISRQVSGRPLRPYWAQPVLRIAGPVGAFAAAAMSAADAMQITVSPTEGIVLRAVCQVSALTGLAAAMRVLQSIDRQTQRGRDSVIRYIVGWGLLVVLVLAWVAMFWTDPFGPKRPGSWGGLGLAAVMVLETGVFWSVVESVAIEWLAVTFGEDAVAGPRRIAP